MHVAQCENEIATLTPAELEEELATLASHLYAGTCRWLDLVAECELRGRWSEGGNCTYAQWLAWRCGLSGRAAREHARVARALRELPEIHAAFACGRLSYSKVRSLTRVASAESERELLELAKCMTASQLERALRAYQRVTRAEADALQANAYVGYCWDEDGSLVIRGRLAPEDGALFLRALEAGRDALREHPGVEGERGSAEPRPPSHRPTNAEALVQVADTALVSSRSRSGGERYQVVVHVERAALAGEGEGGCRLDDGPALAAETARRLSCDSSLVTIEERDGEPLSVGRKQRTIPPALRRALRARDRGCRFPGCENHRFVDAHHIRHWSGGGETKLDNLILLCRRHHRFVHEAGYSIELGSGGELVFRNRWGVAIPDAPRPPPGSAGDLLTANAPLGIDAGTYETGYAERMDLHLTVLALEQVLR